MKAWCKHLPDVCNDWNWVEMRMGKISRWEDAEIQAGLTEMEKERTLSYDVKKNNNIKDLEHFDSHSTPCQR